VPHTHEVTSSILVPSIFNFLLSDLLAVDRMEFAIFLYRRATTSRYMSGSSGYFALCCVYTSGVAGVMVSIVAFQAVDPGSIPGPRTLFWSCLIGCGDRDGALAQW
jgi:hypothetical protein